MDGTSYELFLVRDEVGVAAAELVEQPLDKLCVVGLEFPDEQLDSEVLAVFGTIMSSFSGT